MLPSRNPRDMRGLLKFCLQATKGEDAPESAVAEMDPEKRQWLEEALKSMSVDVFQELGKGIEILSDESVVCNPEATDFSNQLEAFDCIEDWVGQIDIANNFHQLGGFVALDLCIRKSPHNPIVAGACHIVAELSQNNPYCQENFVKEGFLDAILELLSRSDEKVKVKALYAISCITRDFKPGLEKLIQLKGLETIVQGLQMSTEEKVKIKSCFMLSSLIGDDKSVKNMLNEMGLAQLLVTLLFTERDASHEHIFKLLLLLCEDNVNVQNDCKKPGLAEHLQSRIASLKGKDEFQEEEMYCKRFLNLLYPKLNETVER